MASWSKVAERTFHQSETNKQDAAKLMVQLPLAALALGAVTRGAFGLRDMLAVKPLTAPVPASGTQFIGMPQVRKPDEEEEKLKKVANPQPAPEVGIPWQKSQNAFGWLTDKPADWIYRNLLASSPDGQINHPFDQSINPAGIPYTYALGLPAAAAAFVGGYKGVDHVLDKRRRKERQAELDAVRQQYLAMLRGEPRQKTAAQTSELADQFDALADRSVAELRKTANQAPTPLTPPVAPSWLDYVPDVIRKDIGPQLGGMAGNAYGATALLSALAMGALSHKYFSGTSKRKTLEEALRRRAASQSGQPPALVYTEADDE